MVHKVWQKYARVDLGKFGKYIGVLATFHFVAFCWMYFRATDMAAVGQMLSNIFTDFDLAGVVSRVAAYWRVFALMLIGYVVHLLPSNLKNRVQWWFTEAPMYVKVLIFVVVVFGIYQATSADIQPFIYFQF